jgi:transcriptional regulator with XRE-family HTH domain
MLPHIGNIVKNKTKSRGISVSELARRISTSRENIYSIFKRESIDTTLLHKIGEALDYDFFQHYSSEENIPIVDDQQAKYLTTGEATLREQNAKLQQKVNKLEQYVLFLREINELLKESR